MTSEESCMPFGPPFPICPSLTCTLFSCIYYKIIFSEGHCTEQSHFLKKEDKLL